MIKSIMGHNFMHSFALLWIIRGYNLLNLSISREAQNIHLLDKSTKWVIKQMFNCHKKEKKKRDYAKAKR